MTARLSGEDMLTSPVCRHMVGADLRVLDRTVIGQVSEHKRPRFFGVRCVEWRCTVEDLAEVT